jgi:signal peptidase I
MNELQTRPHAESPVADTVARPRKKSLALEYIEAIFIPVLLALVLRQLAVQAFTIPSGSMMDTLLIGDYILVNKFLFGSEIPFTDYHLPGIRSPEHGDIIVFRYPNDESRDFIKRIIAVGGDTVQVRDNRVWLNGAPGRGRPCVRGRSASRRPPTAATSMGASPAGANRLVLRDGRQPGQLTGQSLLGIRQAPEDPRQSAFLIYRGPGTRRRTGFGGAAGPVSALRRSPPASR